MKKYLYGDKQYTADELIRRFENLTFYLLRGALPGAFYFGYSLAYILSPTPFVESGVSGYVFLIMSWGFIAYMSVTTFQILKKKDES